LIVLASGCGDDEGEDTSRTIVPATTETTATTTETSEKGQTVQMREYEFIPDELKVSPGDTLAAENKGRIPHNMTIALSEDPDADPVPVIGTEDVEPGHTAELTLDLGPGEYLLICTIPGHLEQGMDGTITIEE
jgi:plastocyanin